MMPLRILTQPIARGELIKLAKERFGDMVKAVVDIERGSMAIGGDLHSDEEAVLLEDGSRQSDLWGINLYPEKQGDDFVEFDSMINLRPAQHNRSRSVEDSVLREKIVAVVNKLVQ